MSGEADGGLQHNASQTLRQSFFQRYQTMPLALKPQLSAADGTWAEAVVVEAGDVGLECVQASLALDDIDEDVKFIENMPLALMEIA